MAWDDVVQFIRGTRPRPPPGPKQPLAAGILVLASLLHLPLVYVLVSDTRVPAILPLGVGLLAMGIAWSGGVALEGRRRGTARVLAGLGAIEAALALAPLDGHVRVLFLVAGVASLAGLAALSRPVAPTPA